MATKKAISNDDAVALLMGYGVITDEPGASDGDTIRRLPVRSSYRKCVVCGHKWSATTYTKPPGKTKYADYCLDCLHEIGQLFPGWYSCSAPVGPCTCEVV